MIQKRPYHIVSQLVEQPTWGGDYILKFKGLHIKSHKKIGQSYELSGSSQIVYSKTQSAPIVDIVNQNPVELLGKNIYEKYRKMPLLIKFTQSFGNSFQLHARKKNANDQWIPKPESWYFFEDGLTTIGVNPKTDIKEYMNSCLNIERFMKTLSNKILNKSITIADAKDQVCEYIEKLNPYQYVNVYRVKQGLVVDLSRGGIHHSWEEDVASFPLGNILYEVQLDVDDQHSTMRSFDKGKILDDGSVRSLTIQDYFTHIDTDPKNNLFSRLAYQKEGERIISTKHYCLDEIYITKERTEYIEDSFVHLFVKDGPVIISGLDGSLELQRGASCLIPFCIKNYTITPRGASSTLLKTHILFQSVKE